MKVKIIAEYLINVSQIDIEGMKDHITSKGTDAEIARDLARASIEAHKHQPYSMEVVPSD